MVKFIYNYPDTHGAEADMLDAGAVADVARWLDDSGWEALSFTEHPAPGARWLSSGGHQTLDPFIALGHAAAVTSRLRLLTYLTVVPYRNPLLLAKSAATVDKLSNGRFILGVGTGYLRGEFRALGVDFDERNARFDEALDVLALHWSGEPFDYEGSGFNARGIQARPRPVQQPIPIWIGGNAKITRQRVAERAQGWMPLGGTAELLATTRTPSVGSLEDLGQKIVEVKEMAGDRADGLAFVFAYSDEGFATDAALDVERHRDAFGRMADAGITHVAATGTGVGPSVTRAWIDAAADLYVRG